MSVAASGIGRQSVFTAATIIATRTREANIAAGICRRLGRFPSRTLRVSIMAKINSTRNGANVNQHLHHRQELGAEQHEKPGDGDEYHRQQQRRPEQVLDQHHAQRRANGNDRQRPEKQRPALSSAAHPATMGRQSPGIFLSPTHRPAHPLLAPAGNQVDFPSRRFPAASRPSPVGATARLPGQLPASPGEARRGGHR